jgi:hypothetical protein
MKKLLFISAVIFSMGIANAQAQPDNFEQAPDDGGGGGGSTHYTTTYNQKQKIVQNEVLEAVVHYTEKMITNTISNEVVSTTYDFKYRSYTLLDDDYSIVYVSDTHQVDNVIYFSIEAQTPPNEGGFIRTRSVSGPVYMD